MFFFGGAGYATVHEDCGDQRKICEHHFSPSIACVPGTEFKSFVGKHLHLLSHRLIPTCTILLGLNSFTNKLAPGVLLSNSC